ncbi:hypothetical protein KY284_025009 [Solanum tuberosum]|nr:hypothetical protein KY284_025009 [Solanum tuberosum]
MSQKRDPAWAYGTPMGSNTKVKCIFCDVIYNGRIFRHKKHLIGGYRDVKVCMKVPDSVKKEIKEYLLKINEFKTQMNHEASMVNLVDDDEVEVNMPMGTPSKCQKMPSSSGSGSSTNSNVKGPMNLYFSQKPNEKIKGGPIDLESSRKILRDRVVSAFDWWIYDVGLPLVQALRVGGPLVQEKKRTYLATSQQSEGNILKSQKCSSPIHTKKRNRLELKRLNDLGSSNIIEHWCVVTNRNTIDPILLDSIDEANEWLTIAPQNHEDEKVYEGESLTYGDVAMASGVEENIYGFRRSTLRGKERGARGSSSSRNLVDESSDDEEDDDQVETLLMALEEFEDLVEE